MIYIYPTHIKIENYEQGMCPKLEKSLSVWDPVCYRYEFSAFLVDEDKKELIIPGGYPVSKLKEMFPTTDIKDCTKNISDYRIVDKYALLCKPRNDIQVNAIDFLVGGKGKNNPQKYLALQTGQGKTYCVINYLFRCKKLPLIIVDQDSLMQQWKESIMKFTSLMEEEIYVIKGKKSVEELMNMSEKELKKYRYFLGIHRTFSLMFEENPESITKLFDHLKIGIKVFDEAHIEYYNIFYMNCVTNCETIYLSATPERSNPNEKKVYNNMFYTVPIHQPEINDKYLNVIQYNLDTACPVNRQLKFRSRRGFDVTEYSKYFVETEAFEHSLRDLVTKIYKGDFKTNKRVAIIFKMLEHIDMAEDIIRELLEEHEGTLEIGILTGKTKPKDKLKELSKDIILTTDSSFTKGLDVENLEVVINYVSIGTLPKLNQITGRLRKLKDKEVFFVDVVDNSVGDVVKHSKTRMTYYKKIAKKIFTMKGYGM